jgi:hypothetical protein
MHMMMSEIKKNKVNDNFDFTRWAAMQTVEVLQAVQFGLS